MALLQKKRMNGKAASGLGTEWMSNPFFAPIDRWNWNSDLLSWRTTNKVPPANITESNSDYQIDICVPGMKRENFEVNTQNKMLTVSSVAKAEKKDDQTISKMKEFDYQEFNRSFRLPENIMEDKIHAKYDNGILNIFIPKKEITSGKLKKSVSVK